MTIFKAIAYLLLVSLIPAAFGAIAAAIGSPILAACWFGGVFFFGCIGIWIAAILPSATRNAKHRKGEGAQG